MKKINFYLIYLVFIVSFLKGILAFGGVGEPITQAFIDLIIIILFFNSMLYVLKKKKIIAPGFTINIFLFIVIIVSFLLTDVQEIQLIIFIRKFTLYYLFFYVLFNINLNNMQIESLKKLIIFLFIIQVPSSFIKLILLGGTLEKIVGTISITEGSLATIMPLMAISYLISNYLISKNFKYIIWILLFIMIGLMSNKIAILFYLIILFIYLSYFYSTTKFRLPNLLFMKKLLLNMVYLIVIFLLFVVINPRTNPEHKVGGSFDIEYLIDLTEKYNTKKPSIYEGEGQGRYDAPGVVFSRLHDGGLLNILLGFGPGEITRSSFTKYGDPLLEKYNIGYGGRQGWLWIAMQIGVIGMITMALFHFILLKKLLVVHKVKYLNKEDKIHILTALGFLLIYILDFFSYSRILFTSPSVVLTYYFVIFYVLNRHMEYKKTKKLKKEPLTNPTSQIG